jgi:methyltransferase-like protein 6
MDAVRDPFPAAVAGGRVDVVLMTFMLSACKPEDHPEVLQRARDALPPGGFLCFRDYGVYDMTHLRLRRRVGESLYVREDGTLAYFFSIEYLGRLLRACGFEVLELRYATVEVPNRKEGIRMRRVFVHAKATAVVVAAAPP